MLHTWSIGKLNYCVLFCLWKQTGLNILQLNSNVGPCQTWDEVLRDADTTVPYSKEKQKRKTLQNNLIDSLWFVFVHQISKYHKERDKLVPE